MRSLLFALSAVLLLAACGPADDDPGAGGVTAREAQALNEAAEMLDSRPPLINAEAEEADAETDSEQ